MLFLTPQEVKQKENEKIIKTILKEKYCSLFFNNFSLLENFSSGISLVEYQLGGIGKENLSIKGEGCGAIHAVFSSLRNSLSDRFLSLNDVALQNFSVKVDFHESRDHTFFDSPVEVLVTISPAVYYTHLHFRSRSRSLNVAAISAVKESIEYLINTEMAICEIYACITDAKKRNRADLKHSYLATLSLLASTANYEETIKVLKNNDDIN